MSAVNSWRKLYNLSRSELMLLVRALLLLPLTALFVKLFGFRWVYAAMRRLSPGDKWVSSTAGRSQSQSFAIARIVSLASRRGFYQANCLQQSLVLWWLLRQRGIESDLRIGVRKQAGCLEAHAWVEYLGVVLNDRSDVRERFAPFADAISPMGAKAP